MSNRRYATRLNSFRRGGRTVEEAVRLASTVPGLNAVELNFPQHLAVIEEEALQRTLRETGLEVTALNLRYEGPKFENGAFTSPDHAARREAIAMATQAVDTAARLGAGHVILWMADDGWDYPLQVNYDRLWRDETAGFREVALHNPEIRVSVEYKAVDPRRQALIRSMGEAMLAVRDVDLPNFGVTLDLCHSLMAGEHPAAAATLALRDRKLFGVHLNDGYGTADDGLMVGSVRPLQLAELLLALRDGGFSGTYYFDTFPIREDPVAECAFNIETMDLFFDRLDGIDVAALRDAQATHDVIAAMRILRSAGIS